MLKVRATTHYSLIQGVLWGIYAPLFAFGSMYLLTKGLTNSQVGYVIAAGSAVSVLLQPLCGSFADRSTKNLLHRLIMGVSALMVLLSLISIVAGKTSWVCALIFALLIVAVFVITPLTNSLGIFFMERGVSIDFGICRGTGSLAYAVVAAAMGGIVARTGEDVVIWSVILLCALLALAVGTFHFKEVSEEKPDKETKMSAQDIGVFAFLKTHAAFMMVLVGIVFVFINHNIIGFYMYQIVSWHGYGSRELGFASTLMAICEIPALFGLSFINRRISTKTLLRISVTCMFLKTLFLLLAQNLAMIYMALCLQFPGYGIYAGISILYVKETIKSRYQSTAQTLLSSAISIGSVAGSIIGGRILDLAGVQKTLLVSVIFALAGVLIICLFTGWKGKEDFHRTA